jgi:C-terminal processing protease CtpA/Prc
MKQHVYKNLIAVIALSLALVACEMGGNATATPGITPAAGAQPVEITGSFTYSNDIITTYYVEQAVALVDMYGFVKRDKEWEMPIASQTLGFLKLDPEKKTGDYTLQLPAQPTGTFANVSNNGKDDQGVQIFAVSYWPNLTGGPYSEGDDPSRGWPTYLASVVTDTENEDEVVSGNLVVWAPDAGQQFPTGFGTDKKLFTADDPVGPIPAGYSIVNLDKEPFAVTQEAGPKLTLFEPKDVAIKDFSQESYTQAFDDMFTIVKKEYAFNGIDGKHPDWDKLVADIRPRVEAAEKDKDAMSYYQAVRDFTWAFMDGHVGISGDLSTQDFQDYIKGGYGFAIQELDNGKATVIYVTSGGPAAKAGMQVGAEVTEFNGKPIKDAISAARPYGTQSSDFAFRYQQIRYLLRAAPGTQASVVFANPKGAAQTAKLTAAAETDSFRRTSVYFGADTTALIPVTSNLIQQDDKVIGYVAINSNYDDLNLIVRLFQRALDQFKANEVSGIIIDMRYNSGGADLGLAGFLTGKVIPMGQLEYYSDKTGKFEPEGPREKIRPNVEQYHFDKMVLLVGQACYSACELESYGFSQVPDMIVAGETPTAGVEAEVARGQFLLPEGLSLQIPTGRFTLPDGSIFLDGKGVPPTLKVPVDETTVFSTDDVVLTAAENAILGTAAAAGTTGNTTTDIPGKGVTPAGPPKLVNDKAAVQKEVEAQNYLEGAAKEQYSSAELSKMDITLPYTIALNDSKTFAWGSGWCTSTAEILAENYKHIKFKFTLDGKDVSLSQFAVIEQKGQGIVCKSYYVALSEWPGGEQHLTTTVTFDAPINDGSMDYPAGKQTFEYTVYVKP